MIKSVDFTRIIIKLQLQLLLLLNVNIGKNTY